MCPKLISNVSETHVNMCLKLTYEMCQKLVYKCGCYSETDVGLEL